MQSFTSHSFGTSNKVIFLFAGWKVRYYQFWLFAKIMAWSGYQCILYIYSDSFFSPQIEQTANNFVAIRDEVLQKIEILKKAGAKEFHVFGVSLGSAVALMVANKSQNISKIILNTTGCDLVQAVWDWKERIYLEFYEQFRASQITLADLQKGWYVLNPKNNLEHITNKNILLYLSKKDQVISYHEGKLLQDTLEAKNKVVIMESKHLGHFYAAMKNMFLFSRYLEFLK